MMSNSINEVFSPFFWLEQRKRIDSRDGISNPHRDNINQGCPLLKVEELYN